jgi:hypothetical protein
MFIKFQTLEKAEDARKMQQVLLDDERRQPKLVLAPPIPVYDGSFAITKETEFYHSGEEVASIDPPADIE